MPTPSGDAQLQDKEGQRPLPAMALAALGIVYGDLGTSPLYTFQTIVGTVGGHPDVRDALGLLSLVVWALVVTVSVKYCLVVMRADNNGEGGILALMSLLPKGTGFALVACGLFGAALIYGDGAVTPAISVLSAVEGINTVTSALKPYVLPIALVILVLLFLAQPLGTARIGKVFGPVMLTWFTVIGAMGLWQVVHHPEVLRAVDPLHALGFLARHGLKSFIVLGAVFLAVTGGEALYADMGHVGRRPIRLAWFALVLPALLLCYAGQTALLLADPKLQGNPFFKLAPGWAVVPLVVLATFATIIASQAIITGAFSLTRQAMQLGWFPGLGIRQTSDEEYGQIYVPVVNWVLMACTLALAAGFGSSDRLAGAYGTAVSTTMWLTTALLFSVMRGRWKWPLAAALPVAGVFLVIDLAFWGANLLKLLDGGWAPLLIGAVLYTIMTTWRRGVEALRERLGPDEGEPARFLGELTDGDVLRVPGTAVFLSRTDAVVPQLMLRHLQQFRALQETLVSLSIAFEEVPRVERERRASVREVAPGFWHVTVRYGFVEVPDLQAALAAAREEGCPLDLDDALFLAARDEVVRSEHHERRLMGWRRMLFSFMFRNAVRAPDRFSLPRERFLEVGRQVGL